MKPGQHVADFEASFASYVGARHCIAASNGTVTLQAALIALGVKPGDRVALPPLTMAATSIAVLNVGAVPVFVDVGKRAWLMNSLPPGEPRFAVPVSLYGLHAPLYGGAVVDDAAQTLRKHGPADFTSYSLQHSKILQTGEGGMLVTDDESLAEAARSYLSLGYAMGGKARIDKAAIKSPDAVRHVRWPAINGRMADCTAALGLERLAHADRLLADRREAWQRYARTVEGCAWLTPQHVPEGRQHDGWAYAVACDTPARAKWLQAEMVAEGAEMPYGAWRLTYHEPPFREIGNALTEPDEWDAEGNPVGLCVNAESLQPRIVAFQTNDRITADRNARALRRVIARAT